MVSKEHYVIPKRYNSISLILMAAGLLSIIILLFTHGLKGGADGEHDRARF